MTPPNLPLPAQEGEAGCAGRPAAFIDGNGVTVRPPDEVQYRFGCRHGELIEVFSDGDAYVRFYDNWSATEDVKWKHLCGVPEQYRIGPPLPTAPAREAEEDGR